MGEPEFLPFNPEGEVRIYARHLPHWRQPGATYFVTFRQNDSIPASVLAEWQDVRQRWFRAHHLDDPGLASDPTTWAAAYRRIPVAVRRAFERQQARMLHDELDRCQGSCVLRDSETREVLSDSLSFFHGKRLWMGDFVIMPNHAHALVTPFRDWKLEDLLASIKKWSARRIRDCYQAVNSHRLGSAVGIGHSAFWQHEAYDRIVRDREELLRFRQYILRNPLHARLRPDEYSYYAAEWLDRFARLPL